MRLRSYLSVAFACCLFFLLCCSVLRADLRPAGRPDPPLPDAAQSDAVRAERLTRRVEDLSNAVNGLKQQVETLNRQLQVREPPPSSAGGSMLWDTDIRKNLVASGEFSLLIAFIGIAFGVYNHYFRFLRVYRSTLRAVFLQDVDLLSQGSAPAKELRVQLRTPGVNLEKEVKLLEALLKERQIATAKDRNVYTFYDRLAQELFRRWLMRDYYLSYVPQLGQWKRFNESRIHPEASKADW